MHETKYIIKEITTDGYYSGMNGSRIVFTEDYREAKEFNTDLESEDEIDFLIDLDAGLELIIQKK